MVATATGTDILDEIRGQPHWKVVIHPAAFEQERIPSLDECWRIIERTRIARLGWEYPVVAAENPNDRFFPDDEARSRGNDWLASWDMSTPGYFRMASEYWRLYQSGQFIHLFTFREGRPMEEEYAPLWGSDGADATGYLSFQHATHRFTAIFEFASRLIIAGALDAAPVVRIEMRGIKNRRLFFFDTLYRNTDPPLYRAHEDLRREWRLTLADDPVERAREAARWFFERFDYEASEMALKLAQEDFLNNRWH